MVSDPALRPCPRDKMPGRAGRAVLGCTEPSQVFEARPQAHRGSRVTQLLPFTDEDAAAPTETATAKKKPGLSVSPAPSSPATPTRLSRHTSYAPKHTPGSCQTQLPERPLSASVHFLPSVRNAHPNCARVLQAPLQKSLCPQAPLTLAQVTSLRSLPRPLNPHSGLGYLSRHFSPVGW